MPKGEGNDSSFGRRAAHIRWARERGDTVPVSKKGCPEGRVRNKYGKASDYNCTFCQGRQARDWAWIHGTDREAVTSYIPLCKPCHNDYDKGTRIAGIRKAAHKISAAQKATWARKKEVQKCRS